jgi:RNA polymerase sigma factor (sigma-70 family)
VQQFGLFVRQQGVGLVEMSERRRRGRLEPDPSDATFERVYRENVAALVGLAGLLTGSREVAQDVVHDVFLRVRPRLADVEFPDRYLRSAVVNGCRSWHRRQHTADRARRQLDPTAVPPDHLVDLRDALLALSEPQRIAIVLKHLDGLHDDEIAQHLNCRPATVRSHLRRGLARLRKELFE